MEQMNATHEMLTATAIQELPAWKRHYRKLVDCAFRHRNELWLLIGGLAVWGLFLACVILAVNSHPALQTSLNRCRLIFGTVWCAFAWAIICFRTSLDDWIRRHKKRFWICMSGLAVYEVFFGAWAWHFAHSPHPMYPDPRAIHIVVAIIGINVLFFILWPLFCIRFRMHQS